MNKEANNAKDVNRKKKDSSLCFAYKEITVKVY